MATCKLVDIKIWIWISLRGLVNDLDDTQYSACNKASGSRKLYSKVQNKATGENEYGRTKETYIYTRRREILVGSHDDELNRINGKKSNEEG